MAYGCSQDLLEEDDQEDEDVAAGADKQQTTVGTLDTQVNEDEYAEFSESTNDAEKRHQTGMLCAVVST